MESLAVIMDNSYELSTRVADLEKDLLYWQESAEDAVRERERLIAGVNKLEKDLEYWYMRASEAEDDRDRLGARVDELEDEVKYWKNQFEIAKGYYLDKCKGTLRLI